MITLAVTGGIGSGKSVVCSILSASGVPVYDSDSRTKAIYDSDRCLAQKIAQSMKDFSSGTSVLGEDGKIDRKSLAAIVFSNPAALSALESLVHPAVLEDFVRWRAERSKEGFRVVAMESAIILEKPLFRNIADKVIIVDAPYDLRLERACARDHSSHQSIVRRMENQKLFNSISDGSILPDADFVIVNDSDMSALKDRVEAVLHSIDTFFKMVDTPCHS